MGSWDLLMVVLRLVGTLVLLVLCILIEGALMSRHLMDKGFNCWRCRIWTGYHAVVAWPRTIKSSYPNCCCCDDAHSRCVA